MKNKAWWFVFPILAVSVLAIVAGNAPSNATDPKPVRVLAEYAHDATSFSQGLVVEDETLYEGTGKYGSSVLRKIDLSTGVVAEEIKLDPKFFGEGITILGDRIYQLTWKERVCIVYDKNTFKAIGTLPYRGEGWGLTDDEKHLYMSDGTSTIRVLDAQTLAVVRSIRVRDGRKQLSKLNELEFVNGEIYANVWYEDRIARIDPKTGNVNGWLDCTAVYPNRRDREHVLNGIAYDEHSKRLFITGKNWPKLFEIEVVD
jgi:glutaminyl-peptide cyclotransferase